jgi:hypothetical protein
MAIKFGLQVYIRIDVDILVKKGGIELSKESRDSSCGRMGRRGEE